MRQIFATDRLIVRELSQDDMPDLFEMYSKPEVMHFLKRDPVTSLAEMEDRIAPVIEQWKGNNFGVWAMWHIEDQKTIGCCMLKPLPCEVKIEVGWHLNPAYWGSGYATEAAKGAIQYGFSQLELEEIHAILLAENQRSWNVARRCNLEHLGQTSEYHDLVLELFRIKNPSCGETA